MGVDEDMGVRRTDDDSDDYSDDDSDDDSDDGKDGANVWASSQNEDDEIIVIYETDTETDSDDDKYHAPPERNEPWDDDDNVWGRLPRVGRRDTSWIGGRSTTG